MATNAADDIASVAPLHRSIANFDNCRNIAVTLAEGSHIPVCDALRAIPKDHDSETGQRDERLRNIDARQRSVVFSDAVQNEAQLADVNHIDWHWEIQ